MSLKELQEDFNKTIKPQLGEILTLLKNLQLNDNIEVTAAKIITELKTSIQECPWNKEILDALSKEKAKEKEIIKVDDNTPTPKKGPWKYSYPNYDVGNEDLGSGKNPNSISWPPNKK